MAERGDTATHRTYGDGCAAARALDVIGERWALLVVRELLFGPKRFVDLETGMPGVSTNVLSQRLRQLEAAGVVRRQRLGPPSRAPVYQLTEWGKGLEPVLVQLGRWGARSPRKKSRAPLGVDSVMLAFEVHFDPARFTGPPVTVRFEIGDDDFTVQVTGDSRDPSISRGRGGSPDAIVETDLSTMRSLVIERARPATARRSGRLAVTGDQQAVGRLLAAL